MLHEFHVGAQGGFGEDIGGGAGVVPHHFCGEGKRVGEVGFDGAVFREEGERIVMAEAADDLQDIVGVADPVCLDVTPHFPAFICVFLYGVRAVFAEDEFAALVDEVAPVEFGESFQDGTESAVFTEIAGFVVESDGFFEIADVEGVIGIGECAAILPNDVNAGIGAGDDVGLGAHGGCVQTKLDVQIGIAREMMKKGSQHTMNAPNMIPRVLVALRSLAAMSFFFSSRASETRTLTWFKYTGDPDSLGTSGARELIEVTEDVDPGESVISWARVRRLPVLLGVCFKIRERAST